MSNHIRTGRATIADINNLPPDIARMNIECGKIFKVPESLVSNYQKFFNLAIPKDVKQIVLILPFEHGNKLQEIQSILKTIRPNAKVLVTFSTKSSEILICVS